MRTFPTLLVFCLIPLAGLSSVVAQDGTDIIGRSITVRIMPLYQQWSVEGEQSFGEFGSEVSVYLPLLREFAVTVRNTPVSTMGGGVERMSGLTDTQLGLLYHLEEARLVFSLGANLPTGQRSLTRDEFLSNVLLSNAALGMQVSQFGQGLNLNPGVLWSVPVGDAAAFGAGATYQYKGVFVPLTGSGDYDPGDEILVTAGFHVSLADATSLALDLLYTRYGKDVFENEDVYAAGDKLVAGLQYNTAFENNRLVLAARYRSHGKGQAPIAGVLAPALSKGEPNNADISASYSMYFSERFTLGLSLGFQYFEEVDTPVAPGRLTTISGAMLAGVGLAPAFSPTRDITIPLRLRFQLGSMQGSRTLTGLEAGIGVVWGI
ncbi:MAG: hypothetical protein HY962_13050 [Ignavibacteriae bacterium]|nr:hypothetical protein [Ignavibacteriota bacterium]